MRLGQFGLFDLDRRYEELSRGGDPLVKLAQVVDFELFRAEIEKTLAFSDGSKGSRPPWDAVLMFKAFVLQALYGLSDEALEFQIRDRLSFDAKASPSAQRFLGLIPGDPVPDARLSWKWRERLTRSGAFERLFEAFDRHLRERGYIAQGGQIVDATIIEVRRPRLTEREEEIVKRGEVPAHWSEARRHQIDRDGRWTLKRGRKREGDDSLKREPETLAVPVFGYKNHVNVDRTHGLIRNFDRSHAAAFDGHRLGRILDSGNTASVVWADATCRTRAHLELLARKAMKPAFPYRKPRGKPMPAHIEGGNRTRRAVRCPVEHVFAAIKWRFRFRLRSVGLARARARIALVNLTYNLTHLVFWEMRIA